MYGAPKDDWKDWIILTVMCGVAVGFLIYILEN